MNRRKQRLKGEIGTFMRQYQRKAHPGMDPNDRGYDRSVERIVKRMDPAELDELLHDDPDDDDAADPSTA